MSVNVFEDGELNMIAGNAQDNDISDSTVKFTSGDSLNPTAPTNVALIKSGETLKSLINKFSIVAKNTRYLLKLLGTTDLSALADGTVTGAVKAAMERAEKSPLYVGVEHAYTQLATNAVIYNNKPAPLSTMGNITGMGFDFTLDTDDNFDVYISDIYQIILNISGGIPAGEKRYVLATDIFEKDTNNQVMTHKNFVYKNAGGTAGWVRTIERNLPLRKGVNYWCYISVVDTEPWGIKALNANTPAPTLVINYISED